MIRVETESGSTYFVDYKNNKLVRVAGPRSSELREDMHAVPLLGFTIKLGQPAQFVIDLRVEGVACTTRTTTPVVFVGEV